MLITWKPNFIVIIVLLDFNPHLLSAYIRSDSRRFRCLSSTWSTMSEACTTTTLKWKTFVILYTKLRLFSGILTQYFQYRIFELKFSKSKIIHQDSRSTEIKVGYTLKKLVYKKWLKRSVKQYSKLTKEQYQVFWQGNHCIYIYCNIKDILKEEFD